MKETDWWPWLCVTNHKFANLCHDQTTGHSPSDKQVKHMHNKIVTPEWITPVQYEKNPKPQNKSCKTEQQS